MTEPTLFLKPGREKSVLRRHPWIFSGAVDRVTSATGDGQTVLVRSSSGAFLARAAYNPRSQITARIWSWDEGECIDDEFFHRRIRQAVSLRASLSETTNAMRLVNAESDGVPGLIADRYGDFVVCQFLTAGSERWKQEITRILAGEPGVAGVYERSDVEVRVKEGMPSRKGVLTGASPPALVEIWEAEPTGQWRYGVDVVNGHKTGFYLDQRENRKVVAEFARRQKTLNVFCYTGAFTVSAWSAVAQDVVSIDTSASSLVLAQHNLTLNELPATNLNQADAFRALREYRDRSETFDLILLDPPKLAHNESQVNRATRAYKDLNWLAFRLLRSGGHLITFSCSGLISEDLFQKILFGAALDARREIQIIRRLSQAGDHPVLLSFPEAAYLKGFVCRAG